MRMYMKNDFGENLRLERLANDWTQDNLAEWSGLPVSAISHFECGRRSPSLDNLRRLCRALNVGADTLIWERDTWRTL